MSNCTILAWYLVNHSKEIMRGCFYGNQLNGSINCFWLQIPPKQVAQHDSPSLNGLVVYLDNLKKICWKHWLLCRCYQDICEIVFAFQNVFINNFSVTGVVWKYLWGTSGETKQKNIKTFCLKLIGNIKNFSVCNWLFNPLANQSKKIKGP